MSLRAKERLAFAIFALFAEEELRVKEGKKPLPEKTKKGLQDWLMGRDREREYRDLFSFPILQPHTSKNSFKIAYWVSSCLNMYERDVRRGRIWDWKHDINGIKRSLEELGIPLQPLENEAAVWRVREKLRERKKLSKWITIPLGQVKRAKIALSIKELTQQTNEFSVKYKDGCKPTLLDSNPKNLMMHYRVVCSKKDSSPAGHEVRIQFDLSKVTSETNVGNLDVKVSCGCPAFLYWGAQWNLHEKDSLEGVPRPKLVAPTEQLDKRNGFLICKHVKVVADRIIPSVSRLLNDLKRKIEMERIKKEEENKVRLEEERVKKEQEKLLKKKPTPVKPKPKTKPKRRTEEQFEKRRTRPGVISSLLIKKDASLPLEALRRLEAAGSRIVEERLIGDYEFYLVRSRFFSAPQIGMNRSGSDCTDISQQMEKKVQAPGRMDLKATEKCLREWLHEYKRLYIGSYNERKTKFYAKILEKMHFEIKETTFHSGIRVLFIEEEET